MPRLSQFPPKFNSWIPKETEKPHGQFFVSVRKFLNQKRSWDFSNVENVERFNQGLSNAIHDDVYEQKVNFLEFRAKLETVEEAFDSLDRIYTFFENFDQFASNCLRNEFMWPGFPAHVKVMRQWIKCYQEVKHRSGYRPLGGSLKWPGMYHLKVIIPVEAIEKKHKCMDIGTGPSATTGNIQKNFEMALTIYDKLVSHLNRQFMKLHGWMKTSSLWVIFIRQFTETQKEIVDEILERKENHYEDLEIVKTRRYKPTDTDFENIAERSMEAVKMALKNYRLTVDAQERAMIKTVLAVYRHALDMLESFAPFVNAANWPIRKKHCEGERKRAAKAVNNWVRVLNLNEIDRMLEEEKLTTVRRDLSEIYDCIILFCLEYHSPY